MGVNCKRVCWGPVSNTLSSHSDCGGSLYTRFLNRRRYHVKICEERWCKNKAITTVKLISGLNGLWENVHKPKGRICVEIVHTRCAKFFLYVYYISIQITPVMSLSLFTEKLTCPSIAELYYFVLFSMHKIARSTDDHKIVNLAQHPKSSGTTGLSCYRQWRGLVTAHTRAGVDEQLWCNSVDTDINFWAGIQ